MSQAVGNIIENNDALPEKYLTFSLGGTKYGIKVSLVSEITGVGDYTRVPGTPDYVRGVTNLRGKVIPLMDLRLRFGKSEIDYSERTCFIVVETGGVTAGVIVDRPEDVVEIPEGDKHPLPDDTYSFEKRFLDCVAARLNERIFLINMERVFNPDDGY